MSEVGCLISESSKKMPQKSDNNHYNSIPFKVSVYLAWRSLSTKKLRSSLTILGVVIGIGAIFFLISLGLGLQNLVTNQLIGNKSIKSVDVTSQNSRIIKLNKQSLDKISGLPKIQKIGAGYSQAGNIEYNKSAAAVVAYGIDTNYQDLLNLTPIKGRLLKKDDIKAIVVNKPMLDSIGIKDPAKAIGKTISVKIAVPKTNPEDLGDINDNFTIVGVIDADSGAELFMPSYLFEQHNVPQYYQIKLITANVNDISSLRKQIESLGYQTSSPIDTIDQVNQIFKYFNVILASFGSIGMIVAVLGMFNTLTVTLLERTSEIGLMIALGGRNKDMKRLFALEATLLSLIGAIAGILLAVIFETGFNMSINAFARSRGVTESFSIFSTPLWLIFGAIAFMIVVGRLVVFLPARRAARINPIDALRRE